MATNFITTKIDGRIAVVRFDRGDKANALSVEAIRQLTEAARAFHANSAVSAIVLTGNGRNFTLGADLKDPARADQKAQGLAERRLSLRDAIASESVDLVYLDPPFGTGRDFGAYDDRWPDRGALLADAKLPRWSTGRDPGG